MRKTLVVALIGAMARGAMVGGATIAFAQGNAIADRKENRKQSGAAMRAIKAVIDNKGNTRDVIPHAAKLKELELAHVKMYPAGSGTGDTKALPVIWTDWRGFEAASKATADAADALAVAAGSGDLAAVGTAFGAVGRTCGACHDKYRAK